MRGLIVGDSISVGLRPHFPPEGVVFDGRVGRFVDEGLRQMAAQREPGQDWAVICLGTNGGVTVEQIHRAHGLLAHIPRVVWVTPGLVPSAYRSAMMLRYERRFWSALRLCRWDRLSGRLPHLIAGDDLHPTADGYRYIADRVHRLLGFV